GDIYNPTTLQKLDLITKRLVETKGVVPYQVLSIAHPRMKSISTYGGAIQVREVFFPGVPQTQEDAERVKFAVYSTKGIRGLYVSQDDTAALVNAGFWEEDLDFNALYDRMMELERDVEDANHTVYITGFPWLYTAIQRYVPEVGEVFLVTVAALAFLLWNYFRTWTGIWVPIFSGLLSSVWALGMGPLLGVNLDPLVLSVITPPGAHSERPAAFRWLGRGVLALGGGLFTLAALNITVTLLGPVKLVAMLAIAALLFVFHERIYRGVTAAVIAASAGRRRWAVALLSIVLYVVCPIWGWRLKVGDMTPGAALLFADHPYNVAYARLNDKFLGASQLVVIADTGKDDGMKDVAPLTTMEEFADHMETAPGAGVSVTVIDIVKQLARLFHEGEP